MRKRTAWLCGISVTLVVGGYVAWCGRSFYLSPRLEVGDMPPETEKAARRLAEEAGIMKPEQFDARVFAEYLCTPHAKRYFHRIQVTGEGNNLQLLYLRRSGPAVVYDLTLESGHRVDDGVDNHE